MNYGLIIILIIAIVMFFTAPYVIQENTSEYQFYAPSAYGEVKVDDNMLFIGGRYQCSYDYPDDVSERMMSHYALSNLSGHINILCIGLGCGCTLEEILEYNVDVDVVEINYQVILATRQLSNVLKDPHVNIILDDGLSYLRHSSEMYDSILIDIENPSVAHSSNLYTVDAFKIIEKSLIHGGTFVLWNYEKSGRYMKILFHSLKEAFPYVYEYPGVFLACKNNLYLDEYVPPSGKWEINTIDHNILTDAYLNINNY